VKEWDPGSVEKSKVGIFNTPLKMTRPCVQFSRLVTRADFDGKGRSKITAESIVF
jgi:hypothetical protein